MFLFWNNHSTKLIFLTFFWGINVTISYSQKLITSKNSFASKELTSAYIATSLSQNKKVAFVYLDLDNCYNCSQGLRVLASDNEYIIYYLIEGISTKKLEAFKREYGLKKDIFLLDSKSYIASFLKQENSRFEMSASVVVFMENPFFYTSVSLSRLSSINNKSIFPNKTTNVFDSMYYTSFSNLTVFNNSYFFIAAPKHVLLMMHEGKESPIKVDLDSLYFNQKIIESVYSSLDDNLKKINDTATIAQNFNTLIRPQGYNKTSIINFEVTQEQLIIYTIFFYPLWKDTTSQTISLRPFSAIVSLNKFGKFSVIKPLNINNTVQDSFFYDYSKVLKLESDNNIRIGLLPNGRYTPERYFPLDATLTFSKEKHKFILSNYGKRYKIPLNNYDTSSRNKYLLSYVEDDNNNKFFKSHNHYIKHQSLVLDTLGKFDDYFSDTLNNNYYIASATSINDSISNLLVFIEKKMIIIQLDHRNGKLIDYWLINFYENKNIKDFNTYYLDRNNLYVICYNNSLESDEIPKVHNFLIPSTYK